MKINFLQAELKKLKNFKDGIGSICHSELFTEKDFTTKCKFIHYIKINPLSSIGYHAHRSNEEEIYIFISGYGRVCLNTDYIQVNAGDIMIFGEHDEHSIDNTSTNDVLSILVIKILG
jgi:mannose-6-phosphate isomerase-like protein (cupin superfamily)